MMQTSRRLTRHEQKEQTRARLIEAADSIFAESGIIAASLRNICERAGYSQGAFYSNFDSKDDLLLTVLERHIHREVEHMRGIVASSDPDDLNGALAQLAHRLERLAQEANWSLLSVELQLHALRDPEFAARCDAVKRTSLNEFTTALKALINRHHLSPALPAPDLARGLYALWSGLALQGRTKEAKPRDQVFLAFLSNMIGSTITRP